MAKTLLSTLAQKGLRLLRPLHGGTQDKVLVFVHVPKCAGNTLLPMFTSHYRESESVLAYSDDDIGTRLSEILNGRAKCYFGHFVMDVDTIPENFACVSILRDPARRIVSHYHHVLRTPDHFQHRLVADRGYSLLDYALSDINNGELDNGQLRLLVGLFKDVTIDESVFAAARSKISRIYSLIGVTEELDNFVGAVSDLMGWKKPARYTNRNVGNYESPDALPEDVISAIRERNRWDQRLYEEFALGKASA